MRTCQPAHASRFLRRPTQRASGTDGRWLLTQHRQRAAVTDRLSDRRSQQELDCRQRQRLQFGTHQLRGTDLRLISRPRTANTLERSVCSKVTSSTRTAERHTADRMARVHDGACDHRGQHDGH
jgi:hypothetical protein